MSWGKQGSTVHESSLHKCSQEVWWDSLNVVVATVGNMNICSRKLNGSTSFTIYNIPWSGEFQKQRSKHLGILLIFTPIPLTPKKCGLSIGYNGRIWEWHTLTYTISQWCFSFIKFCTFFPLYLTNYLIRLAFWAFPIGLKCVAWSGTKRDQ